MTAMISGGEPLLTVREAAKLLRASPGAVYKLVEKRQIPHLRIGRKILFDPVILRTWLNELAVAVA